MKDIAFAVRFLHVHIFLFVLSLAFTLYDAAIAANDFRNTFVLAAIIYAVEIPWVVRVSRRRMNLSVKLLLAPALIYAFLWLGADGTTLKSGQVLLAGQNPAYLPRSARHRVMVGWHQACDALLGDVERRS